MSKSNRVGVAGLVTGVVAIVLGLSGCDEADGPGYPWPIQRSYATSLAVPVSGDSLLVSVGTAYETSTIERPIRVYVDTAASADTMAHFEIQVIGETRAGHEVAAIDYRWQGDTLQVWCGVFDPMIWGALASLDKDTPAPEWFLPARIDISVPEGMGVRYIGRWYYCCKSGA